MAQNQRNTWGAMLLIGLGIVFLIGQVFSINFWSIVGFSWPVLVAVPGVIFLALAFTGDRRMAGFSIPGMIITGTGAILWYQNLTDNWQSWAYAWTLYPVFLGLSLMFIGRRTENEKRYHVGRSFVNYGLVAFLVGAAFFELLVFHGNGALTRWIVPLGLIGVGGYLLLTGRASLATGNGKRKTDEPTLARANGNGKLAHGDDLQRRIDEAIKEDEPSDPKKV